jgi:tetratricopeptide (TPR) repeat protein
MIGAQSGRWYMYDGARWIPGYPPRDAVEAEPTPTQARETAPSVAPTVETRETAPSVAPTVETRETAPSVAPTVEARETAPSVAPTVETREAAPSVAPTVEARETAPSVAPTVEARETAPSVAPTVEARETAPSVVPTIETREAAPSVAPTVEAREETLTTALPTLPPPLPESLTTEKRAHRELPALPISGPVVIAGAAFVALLGVIALWIVLDNVVPNRPISRFFAGLLGAPAATPTPAAPAGPNIAPLLAQGDQLLIRSQIDVAIVQYQNAAQLAPNSAAPLVRWSRALAFKGLMSESLAKAQQALQRAPNDVEVYAQLCRVYAWNGQIDEAVRAGERAVQLDLQNVNARANLAEAYLLARRIVDAQAAANAALQIAPSSAEARRAQAWVYTIQGQKENALNEWRQTIALEPNFYFRHFEYGEVLRLYFNAPEEAVAEHQKAVTLYGAYVPAISRLGLSLLAVNKPQEAIPTLRRALTLDPVSDAYANLGLAFGMANECSQAIPYFEEALRMDPNNSTAQRGLADCRAGKTPTLQPPQPLEVPITPPIVKPK